MRPLRRRAAAPGTLYPRTSSRWKPVDAAGLTKKVFFDYGDLTDFEKGTMRRLFPFYTFTRKNIPLQFEGLVKYPSRWKRPLKATNVLTSEEMPEELPDWAQEAFGVPVGVEAKQDKEGKLREYSTVFPLGYWLTQTGVFDVLPNRAAGKAIDMLNPFIKVPMEQILNRSLYNDEPIATAETLSGRAAQRADAVLNALFRPYVSTTTDFTRPGRENAKIFTHVNATKFTRPRAK